MLFLIPPFSKSADTMRRNTLHLSHCIWLLFAVAVVAFVARAAAAGDVDTCAHASGDAAIEACTREIVSGKYQGHLLGQLHHDQAVEYYDKRDNDHAIADNNEAIRIDPDYTDAFYGRGDAWRDKGDNDRAVADLNEAVRLNPNVGKERQTPSPLTQ
jgi:tetratricopeptide (TPR) repeat protein